jgi:hypothetical protein
MLSEVERRLKRFIKKNLRSYAVRLDEAAAEIMPSTGPDPQIPEHIATQLRHIANEANDILIGDAHTRSFNKAEAS